MHHVPTLVPVQFKGVSKFGDFMWMIRQPECLFIFNNNEEYFVKFLNNERDANVIGGGNASIRPFRSTRRTFGIPTGILKIMTGTHNNIIDRSFIEFLEFLITTDYDKVFYSCAADGETIGTAIFSPSDEVKDYILNGIQ